MDQLPTQLMAGGILAILVIREVLNFLKGSRASKNGQEDPPGDGLRHEKNCVSHVEFDKHKEAVRYADTCDKVHEGIQRQFDHVNESLNRIETLIRNGYDK